MRKKGFTLVELIATIVILAIIALIAVPVVINQMDNTKEETYKVSVRSLFDSVGTYLASNDITEYLSTSGIYIPDDQIYKNLDLKNDTFISGRIYLDSDQVLRVQNVSDGTFCADGTKSELTVVEGSCDLLDVTVPEIRLYINRTTSSSITIAVNSSDDESGVTTYKYYLNGKLIEENKDNIYTFKGLKSNTEYKIEVRTVNGNNLEAKKTITAETSSNDFVWKETPEGWTHSKTVTLSCPITTSSEECQYQIVGKTDWIPIKGKTVDILMEEKATITARVLKDGKLTLTSTRTFGKVDNISPVINGVSGNEDKWATSKRITVNAVDNESGLADKAYSFDGGKTWQKSSSKTFTTMGTVNIVVKDKVDNISEVYTVTITKLDSTIPKAHSITATVEGEDYTSGTWTNKDIVLKANPSPSTTPSGYTYKWYKKSGNTYQFISGATEQTLTINSDSTETYKVEITTGAGAGPVVSSNTIDVKVDKTAPTVKYSASGTAYGDGYKNSVKVTATCSDSGSGYKSGNQTKTFSTTGNNTISGECVDKAGNRVPYSKVYTIYVYGKSEVCGIASCSHENCGIASTNYKSCRIPDCGIDYYNYNSCRTPACGVEYYNYNSCATAGCGCAQYTCTLYKRCAASACGVASTVYKRCANSACGVKSTVYKSCQHKNCGWGSWRFIGVFNGYINSTSSNTYAKSCTWNRTLGTSSCMERSANTCRTSACGVDYYTYNTCRASGCGVEYYNYNTCRTAACGTETVTGSACNNAQSKYCSAYNTCANSACGVASTVYRSCANSACGIASTVYKSCVNSACGVASYTYNTCQNSACGYAACWHT